MSTPPPEVVRPIAWAKDDEEPCGARNIGSIPQQVCALVKGHDSAAHASKDGVWWLGDWR